MKLRSKVMLSVVAGILALNAGLYVATDAVVMSGFLAEERHAADGAVRSTREVVETMVEESLSRTTDWAEWDATAKLVEGDNPTYAEENVEASSLAALGWDVLCVTRPAAGEDCLLSGLDPERTRLVDVDPAMQKHLRNPATHYRQGDAVTGFVTVGDTVWVTVSRDVKHTDKQPPARPGRFITATRINDAWLARLRKFTGLDISFQRASAAPRDDAEREARRSLANADVTTISVSDERTSSFCWMQDVYGDRCVLVRVDRERPLLAQGQSIMRSSMVVVAAAGLLLLGLTLFAVSRMLGRLGNLLRGVENLRAGSATPVPVIGNDEIATLTTAFNEMSARITDREQSLSAINERMKLVLDSIGDGLVTCELQGTVVGDVSKCAEEWFGAGTGKKVWEHLFPADDPRRAEFEVGWEQFREDFLPFELLKEQMPRRLRANDRWNESVQRIRQFLPERGESAIRVAPAELEQLVARLRHGGEPGELADLVAAWRHPTIASVFARLGRQAARVATTLEKQVAITSNDNALRFDPSVLASFWDAVIHVVRNAIDHGIERPEQREAANKPANGSLHFAAERLGDELVVTIADDGKGVAWDALRASAKKRGLPHETEDDLVAALFTDGVSTREQVTQTSGRGVGMAAVKEACESIGGRIDVHSRPGLGTTFTFRLPQHASGEAPAPGEAAAAIG